jgi:hypothetical protein
MAQRNGTGAALAEGLTSNTLCNLNCQGCLVEFTLKTAGRTTWISIVSDSNDATTDFSDSIFNLEGVGINAPTISATAGGTTRTAVFQPSHSDSEWNYYKAYLKLGVESSEWAVTLTNINGGSTINDDDIYMLEVTLDSVTGGVVPCQALKTGEDVVANGDWTSDTNEILAGNIHDIYMSDEVRTAAAMLRAYQGFINAQASFGPADMMAQVYASIAASSSDTYVVSDDRGELLMPEWYMVPQDGRSDSVARKVLCKFVELLPVALQYIAGDYDYIASLV